MGAPNFTENYRLLESYQLTLLGGVEEECAILAKEHITRFLILLIVRKLSSILDTFRNVSEGTKEQNDV